MLFFTLIFCFVLFLVMQRFNGVFGKVAGTGIGIGMICFVLVLPILAVMLVALPFIVGALIPIALFLGLAIIVLWVIKKACTPTVTVIE